MLPLHRLLAPVPALGVAIVLVASAAWIPVTAQAFGSLAVASAQVTGSGVVTEQTRPVGPFSKLRLDGAITVEARPAASASVSVRGDDNIVPLVTAEVQGETLSVVPCCHVAASGSYARGGGGDNGGAALTVKVRFSFCFFDMENVEEPWHSVLLPC